MTTLQQHVQEIANQLTNPETMDAYEYLNDALDIEYIVNGNKEYLGARVLVTSGGPNIWINTRTRMVEGTWWGERAEASFDDNLGIDNVLSDIYLAS